MDWITIRKKKRRKKMRLSELQFNKIVHRLMTAKPRLVISKSLDEKEVYFHSDAVFEILQEYTKKKGE